MFNVPASVIKRYKGENGIVGSDANMPYAEAVQLFHTHLLGKLTRCMDLPYHQAWEHLDRHSRKADPDIVKMIEEIIADKPQYGRGHRFG